jgi:hypothetical protein
MNQTFVRPNKALCLLWLALFMLSACSQPPTPLTIATVSASPEPVVGQVVTLHIEIMSDSDEPDAAIYVRLPEGVKLVAGDATWKGSLAAKQPRAHEISICVLYPGEWPIRINAQTRGEYGSYNDAEVLSLVSSAESGQILSGLDYHYTVPPEGELPSTPLPDTPPSGICP